MYRKSKLLGESPAETTETTWWNWTYPPEFFDSPWLKLHTTQRKTHTYWKSKASKQKLQKLQGQNKRIYQKSKLLGESSEETTETTWWKNPTPLTSLILPDLNYTLHREKHTHIENLKLQSRNYRNYRVKTNAYIENLNCWESSQQKLQKLQGQKERIYWKSKLLGESQAETTETTGWNRTYPPEFFESPWLKLHTT